MRVEGRADVNDVDAAPSPSAEGGKLGGDRRAAAGESAREGVGAGGVGVDDGDDRAAGTHGRIRVPPSHESSAYDGDSHDSSHDDHEMVAP